MPLLTNLLGAAEQLFVYDAFGLDVVILNTANTALVKTTEPRTSVRYNGEYLDKATQQLYPRDRP